MGWKGISFWVSLWEVSLRVSYYSLWNGMPSLDRLLSCDFTERGNRFFSTQTFWRAKMLSTFWWERSSACKARGKILSVFFSERRSVCKARGKYALCVFIWEKLCIWGKSYAKSKGVKSIERKISTFFFDLYVVRKEGSLHLEERSLRYLEE